MRILIAGLTLATMLTASVTASAGERVAADIGCTPAAEKLTYDCMIMLKGKKSGMPVDGAEVVVKADMASMPLAHNVRPVKAAPGSMPGHYTARLELDMHGEWDPGCQRPDPGPRRHEIAVRRRCRPSRPHVWRDEGPRRRHGSRRDDNGRDGNEGRGVAAPAQFSRRNCSGAGFGAGAGQADHMSGEMKDHGGDMDHDGMTMDEMEMKDAE